MKRILAVILVVSLLVTLCSCSFFYTHESNAVDSFDLGYSKVLRDAFLSDYNWDGTEEGLNIVVPEEYNGATVTGMGGTAGGYTAKGLHTVFRILPTVEARKRLSPDAARWSYATKTINDDYDNLQYFRFKLHISKHIKEAEGLRMGGIIMAEKALGAGYDVFILTCYVTCDEDNKTFYAKDGKLYYRENDALVEDITYEDFNLEEHNEKHKDQLLCKNIFG